MSQDWTSQPDAERVLGLAADPRPAWLWSGDGATLLWHNHAATLFGARLKSSGLKRADRPKPIKGQVARVLRMGLLGRPALSRMQFIAGRKPLSATCICTPLPLGADKPHLLIVGVDPIDADILALESADAVQDVPVEAAVEVDVAMDAGDTESQQDADGDGTVTETVDTGVAGDANDALADAVSTDMPEDDDRAGMATDTADADAPEGDGVIDEVDAVTEDAELLEGDEAAAVETGAEAGAEEQDVPDAVGLSALVEKLARDERLYEPLDEGDDAPLPPEALPADVPGRGYAAIAFDETLEAGNETRETDWGDDDPLAVDEAAFAEDGTQDASARAGLWQLTGRGLTISAMQYEDAAPVEDAPLAADEEAVERTSRYNFEELSRLLHDRVGREGEPERAEQPERPEPRGSLVALSDETLVLNRLPLGILVFRDQDILFANRALVDLTGYDSATALRGLGLAAVFPTIDSSEPAGPVTQLVRRDGERVPVSARLQTISWHGRSAFMLSAQASDLEPLREAEIRRFAALAARTAGQVFIEANRSGIITGIAAGEGPLPSGLAVGQPLSGLVAGDQVHALGQFFALPARFAETERPAIVLDAKLGGAVLSLFAEGRAGIVSGYFGVYQLPAESSGPVRSEGLPIAALARISRELRRPLNTIVGFSELIASEAFGPVSSPRYLEYARDINSAGGAISDLADELDDYVRLAEGKLALSPADIDLAALLADCLVKVRGQAGAARVLLRSAISERLPLIRADAATLKQAVLNMLASAIAETALGSKVVLSAQREEDGSVSIHVRDAAKGPNALAEQFVVFRDGVGKDGEIRQPVRSSIGLTLTRSLVAVNACSLSLDPVPESGTLMTLTIPATLVVG